MLTDTVILIDLEKDETLSTGWLINSTIELLEDEIDSIEEIKLGTICDTRDLIINKLVQAVKQLNKEIKSIKKK